VYEEGDVTVLWNQAVHTDREVTANRPDIIIKNKKEKLKEKFGSRTRKTFDRIITKDSCTWNITHKTESSAV
jgi:hypothetical protein